MGWGAGTSAAGREIGYTVDAECDHPGCSTIIDRGLAYACGGMHNHETLPSSDFSACDLYFCEDHRVWRALPGTGGASVTVCGKCAGALDEQRTEHTHRTLCEVVMDAYEADFTRVMQPPEAPSRLDVVMKAIYDIAAEWDEISDLPADARYMTEAQFAQATAFA